MEEQTASEYLSEYVNGPWVFFFQFCGFFWRICFFFFSFCGCTLTHTLSLLFICGSEVTSTCAFSIFFLSRRALPANGLTVILPYIHVLGAERRLALTCVGEVVALMESSTWQPSRQRCYVFKILSRNKTCFCYLQGRVGLGGLFFFLLLFIFCLQWPPGARGIAPEAGDSVQER